MGVFAVTTEQKLATVERLIPLYRAIGRATADDGIHESLKAIASDLRAVRDFKQGQAQSELQAALIRVRDSRKGTDYDVDSLMSLTEALLRRWPLVSQALERFGDEAAGLPANEGAPR